MGDVWTDRAELYRQSEAHREGADLDLVVEWALGARTALDVATGGGHVARRFREAGLEVTSCDPAPAMRPASEASMVWVGALVRSAACTVATELARFFFSTPVAWPVTTMASSWK